MDTKAADTSNSIRGFNEANSGEQKQVAKRSSRSLSPDSVGLGGLFGDLKQHTRQGELDTGQVLAERDYMVADTRGGVDMSPDLAASNNEEGSPSPSKIQFYGAGLPYAYKFEALYLRFGLDAQSGSEHRINSRAYAAELQLLAYNSLLYKSYSEAATRPFGLMAVAVLIEVIKDVNQVANPALMQPSQALESLLANLSGVKHRGLSIPITNLSLVSLLPETEYFVTYEGSLTTPACHESVHWILLNKPLYIRQTQVSVFG